MISLASAPELPAPRLLRHWRALFRLAWPVALSRVGLVVMAMVNLVMVGRTATGELAALSLGYAVFMPPLIAGVGCMVGIVATAARARGAGDPATPEIALRGLRWAVVVGAVAWLLLMAVEPLLRVIGHAPELVEGGASVARMLAPGALFQIVFVATTFYLEGTGRPRPGLVAMAVANLLNVAFGWLLIGGRLGLPALGADGAALGRHAGAGGDGGRASRLDAAAAGVRGAARGAGHPLGTGRLGGGRRDAAHRHGRRRRLLLRDRRLRRAGADGGAARADAARGLHHPAQHRGAGLHDRARRVGGDGGAGRPGGGRRRRGRGAVRRLRGAGDGDEPRRAGRPPAPRLRPGRRRLLQRRSRR